MTWLGFFTAFITGVLLGVLHFGGLWITLLEIPKTRHPAILTIGSLAVRMSIVVAGFYWVMDGSWPRVAICLGGFLTARFALVHWLGNLQSDRSPESA